MNLWHIKEDTFQAHLKTLHSQESVFTIGNGYFCTRGTFEEGYPRDNGATLLFGVFDDVSIAREELANAPDWTSLKLFLNGERFRIDRGTLIDYQRSLNLQNGEICRTARWESPTGIRISVTIRRFASLADEHIGAIDHRVTLEQSPDDQPVHILLRGGLSNAQGNYDLMHWENVDQGHADNIVWFHNETKSSRVQLVQAISMSINAPHFRKEFVDSDIAPSIHFTGMIGPGETIHTEKIVVMFTSRDPVDNPLQAALALQHQLINDAGKEEDTHHPFLYDYLLTASQWTWQQFWKEADVIVEGDEQAQIGLRFSIYQLRINASTHDTRYSIAAKGMTGFGYRGHIFHDTEIFMLPFFTYVLPTIARNLLIYRHHLLKAARLKAASNGYEGAQYPWESTLSGEETTPTSIIHPETGEVILILNGSLELHITASIAHAVWTYWHVTGDDTFMQEYGAEIMLSTAQFWASRVEWDEEQAHYVINDVIGPDEWHEHVNNNAYTNYMAQRNIDTALQTLAWLQQNAPDDAHRLQTQLDLTPTTLQNWREVVHKIRLPQDPATGLIEQFDGFFQLLPLDQQKYEGRTDSYQGIMGVEEVQKYRIIKQADVLMLLTVIAGEFDRKTKQVNWDYYYPLTDHDYGSSLTPALHVILACELGLPAIAYTQFMKGALVDIENLRGNTPEGIHIACAGAVWQAAILGFAGLRIHKDDDGYTVHPTWPAHWTRLAFHVKIHDKWEYIDLRRENQTNPS